MINKGNTQVGRNPHVTSGGMQKTVATYAISDLHGQYKMFLKFLEKVEFSDKDSLYMLGDAIDRGPDGIL